jgi:hypothetical protein
VGVRLWLLYVGRARDEHANALAAEYMKRSSRYMQCEMREIDPRRYDPFTRHPSARHILLDPQGRQPDSREFAALVEAAERLGLARVEQGDLHLLALGRDYAEANIPVRKEILAGRVLRVPLVRWIYETLQRDDDQRIVRSFFVEALRSEFGDKADEQLDLAVDWGRYADLFAYDEDAAELYLEA